MHSNRQYLFHWSISREECNKIFVLFESVDFHKKIYIQRPFFIIIETSTTSWCLIASEFSIQNVGILLIAPKILLFVIL